MDNYFAKNLRHIRKLNKLSLEEMGSIMGLRKSAVNNYENGEGEPNLSALQKLIHHFGIDYSLLVECDLEQEQNIQNLIKLDKDSVKILEEPLEAYLKKVDQVSDIDKLIVELEKQLQDGRSQSILAILKVRMHEIVNEYKVMKQRFVKIVEVREQLMHELKSCLNINQGQPTKTP